MVLLVIEMSNLLWKKGKKTLNILSTPFNSEEELEKIVFEMKDILGGVFPLKRQVRGGKKPGVPDVIGIDDDGNVCIIEIKNVVVDSSVIPQVLKYAMWAEENPDSIKNLWLELPAKPEGVEIDWNEYQVRIIIVSPEFDRSTLRMTNKVGYPIDLIQIKRWREGSDEFLIVNELEDKQVSKTKPARGLEVYDKKFYERHRNKESVKEFLRYTREIENLVKKKGWPLELKFNKYYCGFKHGFFNAFGIHWIGTKSFEFFFKLPKKIAKKPRYHKLVEKYDEQWKQATFKIDPSKTKVKTFLPLFKESYEYIAGKKG